MNELLNFPYCSTIQPVFAKTECASFCFFCDSVLWNSAWGWDLQEAITAKGGKLLSSASSNTTWALKGIYMNLFYLIKEQVLVHHHSLKFMGRAVALSKWQLHWCDSSPLLKSHMFFIKWSPCHKGGPISQTGWTSSYLQTVSEQEYKWWCLILPIGPAPPRSPAPASWGCALGSQCPCSFGFYSLLCFQHQALVLFCSDWCPTKPWVLHCYFWSLQR